MTQAGQQPTSVPAIQLGERVTMLVGDHGHQLSIAAAPQTIVHLNTVALIRGIGSRNRREVVSGSSPGPDATKARS